MKSKSIIHLYGISLLGASIAAASAASISVNTVGTINRNNRTILEATGNSLTVTTFATAITNAFADNTGGVWNFDGTAFTASRRTARTGGSGELVLYR